MYDNYNRKINYLRISVTDRCNLRCLYCMPEDGINLINHNDILKFEEINEFVKVAAKKGINKIRLTGGEPLVRKGVVGLVKMLSEIEGIDDLSMTTNAILLDKYASQLKEAGLNRINISLDTINPDKFTHLTRGGNIEDVFKGIIKAKEVGMRPIKINCVIQNNINEKDAQEVANWCKKNEVEVRFIEQMNIKNGTFAVVHGGSGGDCINCNRLRLTSNGLLKPCLFNDSAINIREISYENAIEKALLLKPECGSTSNFNEFYNMGG